MVTYLSYDIVPYAAYTLPINIAYAATNGYGFEILDDTSNNFEPRDQRWNRVKILLDRLDSALKSSKEGRFEDGIKYYVWLDADLIFTNHSHALESYVASNPTADIFLSAERHAATGVGNTGCMIVKITEWSLQFFRRWWNNYDRSLNHDQIYFNILYRSMLPTITEHVAILPSHLLNSHPPAALYQKRDHYVLHLMGERMDVRSSLFYKGYRNLCESQDHANAHGDKAINVPHQLGLSKRILLQTTFDIYRGRYQELYEFILMSQQMSEVNVLTFLENITELRELIIQAMKYASFLQEQREDEDSIALHEILASKTQFDQIITNKPERFKIRELIYIRTREIMPMGAATSNRSMTVQLLNACAVFGHDLVNEIESYDIKTSLLEDIHSILGQLRQLVSSESTFLVDEMISGNYLSQGILSSNNNRRDDAVRYFQEAINTLEKNPDKNIFHLFPPLSLLGIEKCKFVENAYDIHEGISILSRSIELQRQILEPEKQLKEDHLNFASDLLHRAHCRSNNMDASIDLNSQRQLIFSDIEHAKYVLENHPEVDRATSIWSSFETALTTVMDSQFRDVIDLGMVNTSLPRVTRSGVNGDIKSRNELSVTQVDKKVPDASIDECIPSLSDETSPPQIVVPKKRVYKRKKHKNS